MIPRKRTKITKEPLEIYYMKKNFGNFFGMPMTEASRLREDLLRLGLFGSSNKLKVRRVIKQGKPKTTRVFELEYIE